MAEPVERPEGVRLVLPTGVEIPLETRYAGLGLSQDDDGRYVHMHIWEVLVEVALRPPIQLKADRVPARTSLRLPVDFEGEQALRVKLYDTHEGEEK